MQKLNKCYCARSRQTEQNKLPAWNRIKNNHRFVQFLLYIIWLLMSLFNAVVFKVMIPKFVQLINSCLQQLLILQCK